MILCDVCGKQGTKESPVARLDITAVVNRQDKQILSQDVCPQCLGMVRKVLPEALAASVVKAREQAVVKK